MTSDLPGETGSLDPGLDQLFSTLTAEPTPAELAGEQAALAMFRANVSPPTRPARGRVGWTTRRSTGIGARWSVRLAAAALALGGMTAAAYAAVLPAPVQHLAHQVFQFVGVPDSQGRQAPKPGGSAGPVPGRSHVATSPGQAARTPAASASGSPAPSAQAPASPTVPSSVAAGPWLLSATTASSEITAGGAAVISGRLTRSGAGIQGVTVTLVERLAGQGRLRKAGTGQTTADGNVAVSVPVVSTNAVFWLTIPGAAPSAGVRITVLPPIATELFVGPGGVLDTLAVSTQYAHRGDVVELQVESPDGTWTKVRSRTLTAAGQATFTLSGNRLKNREVRVLLFATIRHAASVSSPVTVPPPT